MLLEWDPPAVPTPLYQYTNVHYSVSPAAVSPPVRVSSESTSVRITLANDKSYRANVTYTNCAGGNSSFLRISSKIILQIHTLKWGWGVGGGGQRLGEVWRDLLPPKSIVFKVLLGPSIVVMSYKS